MAASPSVVLLVASFRDATNWKASNGKPLVLVLVDRPSLHPIARTRVLVGWFARMAFTPLTAPALTPRR